MTDQGNENEDQFGALPYALVEDLIAGSEDLGRKITLSLESVSEIRSKSRSRLSDFGLLGRVDEMPSIQDPTTCGVDGAYIVESLIGYDLVIAAGLATEGLTPPSEKRYWTEPHYSSFMYVEPHRDENKAFTRALMTCYELNQAYNAVHDVVFVDGSFVTPITALNQALSKSDFGHLSKSGDESRVASQFKDEIPSALVSYLAMLSAKRSDKSWVSVPKYTTKREVCSKLDIQQSYDDRAFCTLILDPGEFIGPVPMESPTSRGWQGYHLNRDHIPDLENTATDIEKLLTSSISVLYYRPSPSNPALRIEVPKVVSENRHRLAQVIQAIKSQSSIPGMLEPQPLYYADQIAKSISIAVPTLKEMMSRFASREYSGNVNDIFFILQEYRTESE